jgi:leukotriene-A4 hydrolase
MIETVESLFGSYEWDRYDMMVMPPSFPFGGMEHARLSFLTPTVITGDRELVSLNAHELSHAWSGNLVTNRYWRDLWLNEGFTTYVEKRVIEALYGQARADDERVVQYRQLRSDLVELAPAAQILAIDLAGQHPDNVFTDIPYDKGSLFLTTLERLYGREIFDGFVKTYFADFAWKTITTEQFEQYLYDKLVDRYPGKITHDKVRQWIYEPGYPADGVVPQSASFVALDLQRDQLVQGSITPEQLDTRSWTVNHWIYLFQTLPLDVPKPTLDALDAQFGLTTSTNLVKEFHWLLYALRAAYQPAIDQRLQAFLFEQGRIKLTKPLYQELIKTPAGIELATSLFAQTRATLHPILVWEIETNVFGAAGIPLQSIRAKPLKAVPTRRR